MDVREALTALTMDIIGISAFGYDFRAIHGEESELYDAYRKLMPSITWFRVLKTLLPFLKKLPLQSNRDELKHVNLVRRRVEELVSTRKKLLLEAVASGSALPPRNLLDIMLQSSDTEEDHLTPEEITDQVLTFLIAGHETTSNALAWAWHLLAQHRDVESKLREEVVRALCGCHCSPRVCSTSSCACFELAWCVGRRGDTAVDVGFPVQDALLACCVQGTLRCRWPQRPITFCCFCFDPSSGVLATAASCTPHNA
jgi:cytochrome P450